MAETFDEIFLETFLKKQLQLFREEVASNLDEAEAFLDDCLAVVCDNLKEVKQYLDDSGMDISHMSDSEIEESSEVFLLPDGRYLIVEA